MSRKPYQHEQYARIELISLRGQPEVCNPESTVPRGASLQQAHTRPPQTRADWFGSWAWLMSGGIARNKICGFAKPVATPGTSMATGPGRHLDGVAA